MTIIAALFAILFGIVGIVIGWLACERYIAFVTEMMQEPHDFEQLFQKNPHPELYMEDGEIDRGEYYVINFPPDFDPDTDAFRIDEEGDEV